MIYIFLLLSFYRKIIFWDSDLFLKKKYFKFEKFYDFTFIQEIFLVLWIVHNFHVDISKVLFIHSYAVYLVYEFIIKFYWHFCVNLRRWGVVKKIFRGSKISFISNLIRKRTEKYLLILQQRIFLHILLF